MKIRHILFALSCACSIVPAAFADYQPLNSMTSTTDRLEALSRAVSQGSYSNNIATEKDAFDDEAPILLNNASLSKYSSVTPSLDSWLKNHPIENGRVSSTWGTRTLLGTTRHHSGIDLSAPTGTPIYATGSGIVTKAGWGTGYGNYVEIDHSNGYITRYAHASRMNVKVGDYVNAGQQIANVGCTGRCTGAHLHFEIVKNGQRQNPSTYLALLP